MEHNNNNWNDVAVPIVNNNDNNVDFEQPDALLPNFDDNFVILQDYAPLEPLDYQREDVDRTAETTSNDTNAVKTDPKLQKKRARNREDSEKCAKKKKAKNEEARRKREALEQELEALVMNNQMTEEALREGVLLYVSHYTPPPKVVNRQMIDDNLNVFHQEKRQNYMDSEARRCRDKDFNEKIELEIIAGLAASDAFEDNNIDQKDLATLLQFLSKPNKKPLAKGSLASRQSRKKEEHEYASNVFHIAWNEHEKRKQEQLSITLNNAWAYYRPRLQYILHNYGGHRQEAARAGRILEFERMWALVFPPPLQ